MLLESCWLLPYIHACCFTFSIEYIPSTHSKPQWYDMVDFEKIERAKKKEQSYSVVHRVHMKCEWSRQWKMCSIDIYTFILACSIQAIALDSLSFFLCVCVPTASVFLFLLLLLLFFPYAFGLFSLAFAKALCHIQAFANYISFFGEQTGTIVNAIEGRCTCISYAKYMRNDGRLFIFGRSHSLVWFWISILCSRRCSILLCGWWRRCEKRTGQHIRKNWVLRCLN